MICPTEHLSDLVYGFGTPDDAGLRRHLDGCAECRENMNRLRDEHELFSAAVRSAAAPRSRSTGLAFALSFAAALLVGISAFLGAGHEEDVRVSARLEPEGAEFVLVLELDARHGSLGLLAEVMEVRNRKGRPVPYGPDPVTFDGVQSLPDPSWAATSGFLRVRGDAVGGSASGRLRVVVPKRIRAVEVALEDPPRPVAVGRYRMTWIRTSPTEVELRFDGPRRHVAGLLLTSSIRVDGAAARVDPGFGVNESQEFYPYRITVPEEARSLRFDFIDEGVEREVRFTVGGLSCAF
jgi:hypothetical protein